MGNCFSDPSTPKSKIPKKGGQKLGSGPSPPTTITATSAGGPVAHSPPPVRYNEPPRVLGGGTGDMGDEEQRERMRRAAEERARSASSKGVTASNPKSGQLSARLAAERKAGMSPQQQDERLMDRGQWN